MPKYSIPEAKFFVDMMHWANSKRRALKCNICGKRVKSHTQEGYDHYFGISHPGKNIYEIFSPIPLESRTRLRMDGVERLI